MRVIEQSHEILSMPEAPLELTELAGRTCYKSEDRIGCTLGQESDCAKGHDGACAGCKAHSSHKFVRMLKDRKDYAMLEFGDIVVRFITNRGVTHELVRHRLCSFAQESTRYVRYDGNMEFIRPVWCSDAVLGRFSDLLGDWPDKLSGTEFCWLRSMGRAEMEYCNLLNLKWRPEQAREVLPNSLKTEIVVKGNIREWMHIFSLRCPKAAHPQMRALMRPLRDELRRRVPVVFDA